MTIILLSLGIVAVAFLVKVFVYAALKANWPKANVAIGFFPDLLSLLVAIYMTVVVLAPAYFCIR